MPKTKTNVWWEHGETFTGVQVPKHWKEVYEEKRPVPRVGNQHAVHFFGKGKRPQPCGISECFYCRQGNRKYYRYRTVVLVDGEALFVDFDAALSRIMAETQIKFEDKGTSISELQEKVYTISRGEKNDRPAYTVTCTGSATLPESFSVVQGGARDSASQAVLLDETPGGLATGVPQKDALKTKKGTALREKSALDGLEEPEPVVEPLKDDEITVVKSYEEKIKNQLSANAAWDIAAALKVALKRKGWTNDRIDMAVECFDKQGNFIARTA